MARLSQSQLSGFRIGTDPPEAPPRTEPHPKTPRRDAPRAPTPSSSLSAPNRASESDPVASHSHLGPVPAAPNRTEARYKVGLTLPLELAERVRALCQQGYALADIVMVAYQDQRDQLLGEQEVTTPRRLVRHQRGRSPLTVALSNAERAALDALAHHLGWTRSHTVTALLDRQFRSDPPQ